jgi:hypothetical protein
MADFENSAFFACNPAPAKGIFAGAGLLIAKQEKCHPAEGGIFISLIAKVLT